MFLLDTNHCFRIVARDAAVLDRLAALSQRVVTSVIVAGELRFGPRDRARRRVFDLAKLGFSDNDLWIAASALDMDATLLSDDADFERMAQVTAIRVVNWKAHRE